MKPDFALNLSHDGIELLHRADDGWARLGAVGIDSADLAGEMARMRETATPLSPAGLTTTLIIPDSQILYTEVPDPGTGDTDRIDAINARLDGATPYALDDIVFDWSARDGVLHIAAVARDTLDEAEAFAREHRFNPVRFVAAGQDTPFPGEASFGATSIASALEPGDEDDAILAQDPPEPEPDPETEPDLPDLPEPEPEPDLPEVEPTPEPPEEEPEPAPQEAPGPDQPEELPDLPDPDLPDTPIEIPIDMPPEMEARSVSHANGPLEGKGFVSRRNGLSDSDAAIPLSSVPSRLILTAARKPAETTHMPVTAPELAKDGTPPPPTADAAPRAKPAAAPKGGILPEPPPMPSAQAPLTLTSHPATLPNATDAPALDRPPASLLQAVTQPADGMGEDSQQENDGAQRQFDSVARNPRRTGLWLTGGLAACLALVFALAGLFGGDSSRPDVALAQSDAARTTDTATDNAETAATDPEADEDLADAAEHAPADAPLIENAADGPGPRLTEQDTAAIFPGDQPAGRDAVGDLYIAAIDPKIAAQDAIALPPGGLADAPPLVPAAPAPANTRFEFDQNGLVVATREGALTPSGTVVYLGRPLKLSRPRPEALAAAHSAQAQSDDATAARTALSGVRPSARPDDLTETNERAANGGRTKAEMATLRPRGRPAFIEARAVQAAAMEAAAAQAAQIAAQVPTAPAMLIAARPAPRPANFDRIVARAQTARASAAPPGGARALLATTAPRSPSLPTSASVAKEATIRNAINLNQLNLIGVYGASSDRRALIRLPSGRYEKVKIGDRLDGGRVRSIGKSALIYTKNGRDYTLEVQG